MSVFKDFLKDSESLFLNPMILDYDYQPKLVPYRENFQGYIAGCIKPLFSNRTGKNLLIFGPPGVGKTVSSKHVLKELEEYEDSIYLIHINCWKFDTSFKIVNEICNQIGYRFTHNKRTDELISIVSSYLNKKSAVIVLDEVDKLNDFDALYSLLEEVYRKTILLITNWKEWAINLDRRLKSRLNLEGMEFKPYNKEETRGILKQRLELAFVTNTFDSEAFETIVNKCFDIGDIRVGLFLMKEACEIAEQESSKKISLNHANLAIEKFQKSRVADKSDLEEEEKLILDLIKENSGKKIKEIYELYKKAGGDKAYTTFHRRINDLKKNKLIETEELSQARSGKSYIVKYVKKLNEF
ncbi:AAA family ATPase [Candidatus Woesearchaeota archaeon]|nr:AAA family ATPase [Candidatus Woesearchaeota archaeon]